jgi:hypothetical protein
MNAKTLELLMERAASWPEEAQAELVRSMIDIEGRHIGIYRLSDDERADIESALAEVARGEVASDEEVAAVFDRYRR